MTYRTRLVDRVDMRIDDFLSARTPILVSIGTDVASLATISRDFLSGGKRFRARFCAAGVHAVPLRSESARSAADDAVAGVAAALEIFHAAALVHDDIIDNSDTRRGAPAAHIRFSSEHRAEEWEGSSDHYGRSSAILLGDLLLGWSDELLDEALEIIPSRADARRARLEFNRMRTEVTVGQYLDILEESAWSSHPESEHLDRARRVVVYKSAKYSVEAPLAIGAALAGAEETELASLRAFGLPLGVAFQLRDDVLGVFGDAAVTGKPSGDDLLEGKRTMLIAYARAALDPAGRASIDDLLGRADASADEVAAVQDVIRSSGALDRIEELIDESLVEARTALAESTLDAEGIAELEVLADLVTRRDA